MTEEKPWWLSRTIWSGFATSLLAVAVAFGIVPPYITETMVEQVLMGILGLLTIYFRVKANSKVSTKSEG